jgi:hypothetical protein
VPVSSGLGGGRGLLGVVVIALGVGLAYGSLVATVLAQWFPPANGITGILLLGSAAATLILIWLLGAVLR